jgi:hypothetical protein
MIFCKAEAVGTVEGSLACKAEAVGTVERCLACEADAVGTVERCLAWEADAVGTVERCLACEADAVGQKCQEREERAPSYSTGRDPVGLVPRPREGSAPQSALHGCASSEREHHPRVYVRRIIHLQILMDAIVIEVSTQCFSRFRLHSGEW